MFELHRIYTHGFSECLFIGNIKSCEKAKKILTEYHKYDKWHISINIKPVLNIWSEQRYIEKVLDEKNNFDYGM